MIYTVWSGHNYIRVPADNFIDAAKEGAETLNIKSNMKCSK